MENMTFMLDFLQNGTSCGGLRSALLSDLRNDDAQIELLVLAILGKVLTGPWVIKFYCTAAEGITHMEGIDVIKKVLAKLRKYVKKPLSMLRLRKDAFGNNLDNFFHSILGLIIA